MSVQGSEAVTAMIGERVIEERYNYRAGERIGDLVFLRVSERRGDNNRLFGVFACCCGNERIFPLGRVLNGRKKTHCGCKTDIGAQNRVHGMRGSREYSTWIAIKNRCLNEKSKDYHRYGGKGITICTEWIDSFESFYSHVGRRPYGTSIDRIDNLRGYVPGNVRWATASQQQRNRGDTRVWNIKGIIFQTCYEAAAYFCVSSTTVCRWVNGAFDARRNSITAPRDDCYVTSRY